MRIQTRMGMGLVGIGILSFGLASGCRQDAAPADRPLRDVTVRSVTHYGQTLDQQATPQQVAYVLLRAIRDDFLAESRQERNAALDVQLDLAAANVLEKSNSTNLTRVEFIDKVIYLWTPTVSHYVQDFPMDWSQAKPRLIVNMRRLQKESSMGAMECQVLMEAQDPDGDPNAQVVMVIYMAEDEGFWRVKHLGFLPTHRSIPLQTTSAKMPVSTPSQTSGP